MSPREVGTGEVMLVLKKIIIIITVGYRLETFASNSQQLPFG